MIDIEKVFDIKGFYSAFRFEWDPEFIFSGERHDFWEVVFVESGKAEVTENGNIYLLEENNVIVHAPMEFHSIHSMNGTAPKGYIITFDVSGELPLELKNGVFTLTKETSEEYVKICRKIVNYHMYDSCPSPYLGQELTSLFSAFLIKLAQTKASERVCDSNSAAEYKKLVSEMVAHVCDNYTLSDFALSCNMSVSYIKLLFKRYANVSPKSYYAQLRADHAARLLLEGYSVSDVSEMMSFSSPGYFTVFFKRQYGKNPLEYQKNN